MRKYIILLAIMLGLCGCASKKANFEQIKEEEGLEYETVNTSHVGSTYSLTPSMRELREAVIEILGENYWPDALYTSEEFAERTGISEDMYENFLAEYQHTEAGTDMMILIEAREDYLDLVETRLNEYRELLLKIYEQQPQNHAKVYASRIEVIDNYVCFVQLGADTSFIKDNEEELIAYCQQENERALDILEKRILE